MAKQHVVVEDIDAIISAGMAVRDASGERIGSVRDYSTAAAYLEIHTGLVAQTNLFVPYSAIKCIDPHEVYLSLDKDVLARHYGEPPQARTVVQGHTATLQVSDGYDGSPEMINRVDLAQVRGRLARGMAVYDRNSVRVGTVDGIDVRAGYLLAKRNRYSQVDLFIPFAAVNSIDREFDEVILAMSKDVLEKEYGRLPDGIVLHIDSTEAPAVIGD